MDKCISGFLGDYAMLNPAYLEPCEYDGDRYPTIIAAVEASKFPKDKRAVFMHGSARVANQGFARPYGEEQVKVLTDLLTARFAPGTKFREVLDSTKGTDLVYTNDMHRNFYGACVCDRCRGTVAKNYVGEILERIRDNT